MYENPQNVVLPEQTQMDKIIAATLYLLNTGSWEASVSLYTDVIQNACTPLDNSSGFAILITPFPLPCSRIE